ncbi:protein FAR1-RELATED SEQUENCE 5 isoform X1 [Medicago truncatula]|uniref:protein FAR1-RELATED SEQUENCE 5 isoform X1 n=1 Tax=Medicago truncatula TaxID=3880 RepID=UPI000D2F3499|nr:protein FAR1-RELATED SEQUENCE 5 isoform X1 [Medicago truncatula]
MVETTHVEHDANLHHSSPPLGTDNVNITSNPMVEGVEKLVNDIVEQAKENIVSNVPHLEMEFESEALAYEFYNEYSRKCGFGIRREYANKSKKDGVLTSRIFMCSKEGRCGGDKRDYLTKEARAETRTGCLARMVISLVRKIGKYKVIDSVARHNHLLLPAEYVYMICSHRHISESQASQIVLLSHTHIYIYIYKIHVTSTIM